MTASGTCENGGTIDRETLIAIHGAVTGEITTLRDSEFRTALYSLGLDAAVIAVFSNDRVANVASTVERWGTIGLITLATALLLVHLFVLHRYLTTHRAIRRRIERQLGVHSETALSDGGPLFPTEWQGPISMRFQMFTLVVPIVVTILLFHLATCLLIFHVTS